MSVLPAGLGTVLRIARRDALRAKGRSALIVLMVMLPVLGMSFADVLARTSDPDPDEKVARELGRTSYVLQIGGPARGGEVKQAPDPFHDGWSSNGDGSDATNEGGPRLAAAVPRGARALTETQTAVSARTEAGTGTLSWTEVAVGDPVFRGRFALTSGRVPRAAGEVAVTPAMLDRLGVPLGGTVHVTDPQSTFTVVGTLRRTDQRGNSEIFALPGALIGARGGIPVSDIQDYQRRLYVTGAPSLTWPQVEALNAKGLIAYDHDVVLHQPPRSAVPFFADDQGFSRGSDFLYTVLLGGAIVAAAALEVMLLAGAAFAVGARRQARSLALLAANGATRQQVRLVVLCAGFVLGVVGAVTGTALGIVSAAITEKIATDRFDANFARFDVRPLELLAIVLIGIVTGVLAAVLPSRTAARQDVVAVLGGRRGELRTPKRVPAFGTVLTAIGVAAATTGSLWTAALRGADADVSHSQSLLIAGLVGGGAVLTVIGLVILTPAIVGLVGRLGRFLPLAPRLAVRDAARHRGRSAPAMAAVLAAVSGSAALLLMFASMDDADRRDYTPQLPALSAAAYLSTSSAGPRASADQPVVPVDPQAVVQVLSTHLAVRHTTVMRFLPFCADEKCTPVEAVVPKQNVCPDGDPNAGEKDWRCKSLDRNSYSALSNGLLVADADELQRIFGISDPAARRALESGGAVTSDPQLLAGGKLTLAAYDYNDYEKGGSPEPKRSLAVPAAYIQGGHLPLEPVLSPEAAQRLGVQPRPMLVLAQLAHVPSQDEEDATRAALTAAGLESSVWVEHGYTNSYSTALLALLIGAAVITLGASGIATGLAQADARADHATLAAVGATPRLRRSLASFQALTIALLGTALGIAAGFVPAVAVIGAINRFHLVLPWLSLLGLLVGVPLLAGAFAWLLTRSRLPLERRAAA